MLLTQGAEEGRCWSLSLQWHARGTCASDPLVPLTAVLTLSTDSTIAPPPKTSDYIERTFHGCSTRGRMLYRRKKALIYFLFAMDYRTMRSGWQRGSVFQEIRPGAGFIKTGDFVGQKLGGGLPWNDSFVLLSFVRYQFEMV